jgi:uncharacterized protein
MDVDIRKPTEKELQSLGVRKWPIWTKEASTFEWEYDEQETCYILEGRVRIKTEAGEHRFGAGDLVVFRKGLKCTWEIAEAVRKHYRFG